MEPTALSFKFSKTTRKQLNIVQNSNDSSKIIQHEEEETEIIASDPVLVSGIGKGFETVSVKTTKEEEVVIPALKNTLQVFPTISAEDPDAAAKRALLEDAQKFGSETNGVAEDSSSIPVYGAEKEKLDIASISTDDANYDAISVDVFGKALLRGMGWKEGQPIGRSGKKTVAPVVTAPRPKGLGLGAEIKPPPGTSASSSTKKEGGEEELVLKIGAFVKRMDAKSDDVRYGKVISWDEDNARIVVQMAIGKSTVRLSQHVVRVVSKKEYERAGKVINQSEYEEFKNEEEKKFGKRGGEELNGDIFGLAKKDDRKADVKGKERSRNEDSRSRKDFKKESSKYSSSSDSRKRDRSRSPIKAMKNWLRPDIRVRIVDDKYRRGKFYKSKAVVVDVKSAGVCSCIAEDGKTVLDDLSEDMLETVIPKKNGAAVLIVRGSNAGKVGTMLERDSHSCKAVVQLSDAIKNISFDDICEYVGESAEF